MGWYSSIGVLGRPKIRMDSPDRSRYGTLRSTHTPISVIPLGTMMNSESPLTRNKYRLGCGLTRGFLPAARASSPRIASGPVQHPDRLDQLGRHPDSPGPVRVIGTGVGVVPPVRGICRPTVVATPAPGQPR